MNKHDVKRNELRDFNIDCTKNRCPYCGEYFGNYLNTEMFVKLKLSKRRPKHTRLSHTQTRLQMVLRMEVDFYEADGKSGFQHKTCLS